MIIEKVKEFGGHLSFYFSTGMTWLLGNQVHEHAMNFKDTLDYIGISTLTNQYKCNLMVITLDKRKEQIVWKDLDCPKDKKKKKWFKILN